MTHATIFLYFNKAAEDAAKFCAETFPLLCREQVTVGRCQDASHGERFPLQLAEFRLPQGLHTAGCSDRRGADY